MRDAYVIIYNGNTLPHELHKLCTHSDWYVRAMVAQHPNVTVSDLDLLSFDIDSYVRSMVREKICTMMFHNYSKQLESVYIKCEAASLVWALDEFGETSARCRLIERLAAIQPLAQPGAALQKDRHEQ